MISMTGKSRGAVWQWLRWLPLLGVAVAIYVYRIPIGRSLRAMAGIHPAVVALLPLFWLTNQVATVGWRTILKRLHPTESIPGLNRMSVIRFQAVAINLILPLAAMGGEVLRSSLLARDRSQISVSSSSVVLDTFSNNAAGLAYAALFLPLGLYLATDSATTEWILAGAGVAATGAALLSMAPFVLIRVWKRSGKVPRFLRRVYDLLAREDRGVRAGYFLSIAWHLAERTLFAVELYIISMALGVEMSVLGALFVAAAMTAASFVFFFVPGQIGGIEGGIALAFTVLGQPGELGLAVALVRRVRQAVICGLGMALLALEKRIVPDKTAE